MEFSVLRYLSCGLWGFASIVRHLLYWLKIVLSNCSSPVEKLSFSSGGFGVLFFILNGLELHFSKFQCGIFKEFTSFGSQWALSIWGLMNFFSFGNVPAFLPSFLSNNPFYFSFLILFTTFRQMLVCRDLYSMWFKEEEENFFFMLLWERSSLFTLLWERYSLAIFHPGR